MFLCVQIGFLFLLFFFNGRALFPHKKCSKLYYESALLKKFKHHSQKSMQLLLEIQYIFWQILDYRTTWYWHMFNWKIDICQELSFQYLMTWKIDISRKMQYGILSIFLKIRFLVLLNVNDHWILLPCLNVK